ncbi:hypothetical protein [Pedobacter rhodius]|uniref:Bacteriocin n=1 Tax=Pedobacter rhodius TaxID=3004098 RepID=A0ABT4KYI4_9SPHI|nr:hypothetical protein [Pedobacter sp. SJ11]MCZ4223998.1 hypothetical protein [Pedobacter sp. SJ11]
MKNLSKLRETLEGKLTGGFSIIQPIHNKSIIGGNEESNNCSGSNCVEGCGSNLSAGCGHNQNTVAGCGTIKNA